MDLMAVGDGRGGTAAARIQLLRVLPTSSLAVEHTGPPSLVERDFALFLLLQI